MKAASKCRRHLPRCKRPWPRKKFPIWPTSTSAFYISRTNATQQAVNEFREAIRIDPSNYDAHYRLARLLKEIGRKAEADKEFAIVQKLHEKKTEEPLLRISGPR